MKSGEHLAMADAYAHACATSQADSITRTVWFLEALMHYAAIPQQFVGPAGLFRETFAGECRAVPATEGWREI